MQYKLLSQIIFLIIINIATYNLFTPTPTKSSETSWLGTDFVYGLTIASSYYSKNIDNPYAYEDQIQAFKNAYNLKADKLMPVGWSPVTFVFIWPYHYLADSKLAVDIQNFISLAMFSVALILTLKFVQMHRNYFFFTCACILIFFSYPVQANLLVCQFGILALSSLCILMNLHIHENTFDYRVSATLSTIAFLLCSIKITYLLMAICILLISKKYKLLVINCLFVAVLPLILFSSDYLYILESWIAALEYFNNPKALYWKSDAMHNALENTTAFKNAFLWLLGVSISWPTSRLISILAYILAMLISVNFLDKTKMQKQSRLVLCLTIILFFSNYIGFHDEILIFLVIIGSLTFQRLTAKDMLFLILPSLLIRPDYFILRLMGKASILSYSLYLSLKQKPLHQTEHMKIID